MSRMPLLHQLPNMLTLLRIGAVPVLILFLHSGRYGAALAVFFASASSITMVAPLATVMSVAVSMISSTLAAAKSSSCV